MCYSRALSPIGQEPPCIIIHVWAPDPEYIVHASTEPHTLYKSKINYFYSYIWDKYSLSVWGQAVHFITNYEIM